MSENIRGAFVERFGAENADRVEACAQQHKTWRDFDAERGYGSDVFRWAVLMVISFECLTRFAASHGFTCDGAEVYAWLKEPAQRDWLAAHDGDFDAIAMLSGAYNDFMPTKEAAPESQAGV